MCLDIYQFRSISLAPSGSRPWTNRAPNRPSAFLLGTQVPLKIARLGPLDGLSMVQAPNYRPFLVALHLARKASGYTGTAPGQIRTWTIKRR